MNAETKLALGCLATILIGIGLIAWGLGATSKPAAFGVGLAMICVGVSLFSVIWRARP